MASAFLGALVSTAAAALANRGTPAMGWIIAALVLYPVAVVITITVHVPLNDAIKAAGNPGEGNTALVRQVRQVRQVRERFRESRWAAWNLARAATTTAAFGLLAWALILYGRAAP